MNILLCTLGGALCTGVIVYLWAKGQLSSMRVLLQMNEQEKQRREEDYNVMKTQCETTIGSKDRQIAELVEDNKRLTAAKQVADKELELLQERMQRENEERDSQFQKQLKLVQEQLKNATNEILGQRSKELSQQNNVQMTAIIDPLKETIKEMRTAMDNSRDTHNKNTASLEKAIEEVMRRTREIGEEADKLANALRNENKMQGNWGEMILSKLLESQGLKEGIHYETQVTLRDKKGNVILNEESGKRMIPDTILHYPDGKDAVIDSKVSLTAFVDYQNAETEEEKSEALMRHVKSVRAHVEELARKDYSSYIKAPRQSLNYVIMFVPNEGALQLAFAEAPELWREAFAKNVFITGEQNLVAALRIIQIAWTQMMQAQNQEAIFDEARKLLDRVADFVGHFEDVGKKLNEATTVFGKASDKLYIGRQSIAAASQKLVALGAKTSKANKVLPEVKEELKGLE